MGIFTRVRDILSANINAALDKAEDPEKLVKQMIREMEDTLVEIKAACAGAMAQQRKAEREQSHARRLANRWSERAELEVLEAEARKLGEVTDSYRGDIIQIEEKLQTARERQQVLVQRHIHAVHKRRAQEEIRKFDTSGVIVRFDRITQRVERAEAEAEVAGFGRNGRGPLEDEFTRMERDERIERELNELKARVRTKHAQPVLA
jgi:phage shock protein A